MCMREKAWLAARVSLRLARLCPAPAAAAVAGLLVHALVTKQYELTMYSDAVSYSVGITTHFAHLARPPITPGCSRLTSAVFP